MTHNIPCAPECCGKCANYAEWTLAQIEKAKRKLMERRLEIKALLRPLMEEEAVLTIMEREYNKLLSYIED